MLNHLRANLWLLVLTRADLLRALSAGAAGHRPDGVSRQGERQPDLDADGKPIGSRLIAQPFTGDEYFQPRPSAASYNGAASGASQLGRQQLPAPRPRGPAARARS